MIITRPIQRSEVTDFVLTDDKEQLKVAKKKAGSKLPTLFTTYRQEAPQHHVTMGFKKRQTSYACEITWWDGISSLLQEEVLKACIFQSILEGRKRVEIYHPQSAPRIYGLENWWTHEGTIKNFTDDFDDVDVYSFLWYKQDVPELVSDSRIYLIWNDVVEDYSKKNIKIYSDGETPFSELIVKAQRVVTDHPQVQVLSIPEWHGHEDRSEYVGYDYID